MSDSMEILRSRDRRPWPWRRGAWLARLGCVAVIGATCGKMPTPAAAAEPPGRTEGKWLVDLGREYSQSAQATGTDNDTEMTLAFMQAASRIEPTLAEAWLWQQGLLLALGRESDAVEAIGKYVERQPDDWLAQSRWIALKTDSLQTIEDRLAFWKSRLEATDLPSEVASDLHYRIAEYHYNRRETDAAAKSLDAALTAFPPNLAARQLRVALAGGEPTLSQRMELALAMVRLNPTQPVLLWDVATLLDGEDMDAEAQRWYTHALAAFKRSDPAGSPPAAFLLDMAASQLDAGQTDAADRLARQVLAADGPPVRTRRLLAEIARRRDDDEERTRQLTQVRAAYESALAKTEDTADAVLAAEIAWFHCVEDPNLERAVEMAKLALDTDRPTDLARRAYGYATAEQGEAAEAIRVLEPLPPADPWAMVALAAALAQSGNNERAIELLTQVARQHRSGRLFETVSAKLKALGAEIPSPPSRETIKAVLTGFDETVLLFGADPKKYLDWAVTILPGSGEIYPGQPVWCQFVLKNKGPIGISLGEALMVNPTVLVSARSEGDQERQYGPIARVEMNRRQWLPPGESISVTETVDLGWLRATLIGTPQQAQTIEITPILSPIFSDTQQRWQSRLAGFEPELVRATRLAAAPDAPAPGGFDAALHAVAHGPVAARVEALERLMSWLAEQQHLQAGRLRYTAKPIDAARLHRAIEERFADSAWEVRAHLAESLRWVTLDKEIARHASALLNDEHWLVRLLAVRMFADQHGEKFAPVAEAFAEADPDALVREVCSLLRQRWAPTTQPATTAPATP